MMTSSVLQRIDKELYNEINKFKTELEDYYGRKITFAEASKKWLKKVKDNDTILLIR